MNQLAERGINGWKYISEAMGVSTAEAMKMAEQGAIDATTAINAVVSGMQTNFVGGMDAMSKTVPGLLSTIKDNAGMVMKEIGDSITEAFDLKGVLSSVATWLTEFATVVKSAGIKEAIQGLVPPEVIIGIGALAGAIVGVAVPAITMMAGALGLSLAPMAAYIAIGATIGALAYEIWGNWEPLCELFSALWSTVSQLFSDYWGIIADVVTGAWEWITSVIDDSVGGTVDCISTGWEAVSETSSGVWQGITSFIDNAWQSIKQIVADGIAWIVDKMQPLLDLVGSVLPSGVKNLFSNLASGISRVSAAASKLHLGGIDVSNILGQGVTKPNTNFTGLHGSAANAATAGAGGGGGGGGGKSDAEKEYEKLERAAEQTSKRIQKEWIQLTGTKIDALDAWYKDEVEKLDESKSANENYERDLQRVGEIYAEKRRKITQQEAQDKLNSFRDIADGWLSMQKELMLGGMTGSQKDTTGMAFDVAEKIKSAGDYYDKISTNYSGATAQQKENILAALDQVGIKYTKTTDDMLNFDMAKTEAATAYKKKLMQDYTDYYATCKDIQSDIDAAYASSSMAKLQETLTAENAIRMNDYEAQKTMMQTYQEAFLAAHSTTAELMANLYKGGFDSMSSSISDLITGAKTVSEAFTAMGQTLLKVVADYVAKWIDGRVMMAIFGKTTMAAETATGIAAGAAMAAAWAPAAAMVSLASFGANSAPAMAGIAATTGLAAALSVPALASGGITTGPTLAEIGEGHYKEAVVPLNRKAFEKAGLAGNDGGTMNSLVMNISAIDADSFKKMLKKSGGREISKYFSRQASEFAGVTI